jgi:hypothetical protein
MTDPDKENTEGEEKAAGEKVTVALKSMEASVIARIKCYKDGGDIKPNIKLEAVLDDLRDLLSDYVDEPLASTVNWKDVMYKVNDSFCIKDSYLEYYFSELDEAMAACLPYFMCAYFINRNSNRIYRQSIVGDEETLLALLGNAVNTTGNEEKLTNTHRNARSFVECFSLITWKEKLPSKCNHLTCILTAQAIVIFMGCVKACLMNSYLTEHMLSAFHLFEIHALANVYSQESELPCLLRHILRRLESVDSLEKLSKLCDGIFEGACDDADDECYLPPAFF